VNSVEFSGSAQEIGKRPSSATAGQKRLFLLDGAMVNLDNLLGDNRHG